MAKYHINPRTGKAGACGAKHQCPFGDLKDDHYSTREEAQEAYEKKMAANSLPSPQSKIEVRPYSQASYSGEDVKTIAQANGYEVLTPMIQGSASPKLVSTIVDNLPPDSQVFKDVLTSSNKAIGYNHRQKALKSKANELLTPEVINAPAFNPAKHYQDLTTAQKLEVALKLEDQDKLASFAERALVDDPSYSDARVTAYDLVKSVYSNGAVSERTRERLLESSSRLRAVHRLRTAEGNDPGATKREAHQIETFEEGRVYRMQIDGARLAAQGVRPEDVEVMVNEEWGLRFDYQTFDQATGEFRGEYHT